MMKSQGMQFPGGVLSPVDVAEFFDQHWEVEPLHISRSNTEHFADLVSVAEIESVLSTNIFSFPTVQLTQADQPVPVSEYADSANTILLSRLLQRHQQGASIVLSEAQKYFPALAQLCRRVQTALQMRCQTNLYYSPAGRQGFRPHYDSHDVFVLQVSGKKTFRFYGGGVDLPFSENSFDPEHADVGDMTEEIELGSGDTLYIPRGLVHDAVADSNVPSLHITLGVYALPMRNLLQEIVQLAAEQDVRFRRSIDRQVWQAQDGATETMQEQLLQLLADSVTEDNVNSALSRLRDDIVLNMPDSCHGMLTGACVNPDLPAGSTISVRPGYVVGTQRQDQKLLVRLPGRIVEFEEPMVAPVEALLHVGKCKVDDLTDLNSEQKIALASRLLTENIVEMVDG